MCTKTHIPKPLCTKCVQKLGVSDDVLNGALLLMETHQDRMRNAQQFLLALVQAFVVADLDHARFLAKPAIHRVRADVVDVSHLLRSVVLLGRRIG